MYGHCIHNSRGNSELALEARSSPKTLLKLLLEKQAEILTKIDSTNRALQLVQQNIHHSEAKLDNIISQLELISDEPDYNVEASNT